MFLEVNKENQVIKISQERPETENELLEIEGSWTNEFLLDNDVFILERDPICFMIESTVLDTQPTEIELLQTQINSQQALLDDLIFNIIPNMVGDEL